MGVVNPVSEIRGEGEGAKYIKLGAHEFHVQAAADGVDIGGRERNLAVGSTCFDCRQGLLQVITSPAVRNDCTDRDLRGLGGGRLRRHIATQHIS